RTAVEGYAGVAGESRGASCTGSVMSGRRGACARVGGPRSRRWAARIAPAAAAAMKSSTTWRPAPGGVGRAWKKPAISAPRRASSWIRRPRWPPPDVTALDQGGSAMSLLTQPPVVPLATYTARTHELRIGSEVVLRDGTSAFVSEVGADGRHMFVQLTSGHAGAFR